MHGSMEFYGMCFVGGRLPLTWYPESYAQKVPMTDMRMRPDPATGYPGRTYRFYTGPTVYSFGDGLSYSDYNHVLLQAPTQLSIPLNSDKHSCYNSTNCESLSLAHTQCGETSSFDVRLSVHNAGGMAGGHTVFLFFTPPSVHNAPAKHLVGFEKVYLEGKGKGEVVFKVDLCRDLSVVDEVGERKVALGEHVLHVGNLKHSLSLGV